MNRFVTSLLALLFGSALLAAGPAWAEAKTLRITSIPDESPTELQRKFAPLAKHLEAVTGMTVEYTPVTDYAAVVEALAAKKIDLAWLGGFTFVQARLRTGDAIPIVQRASRFIPTRPENYQGIEAAARSAGLLK